MSTVATSRIVLGTSSNDNYNFLLDTDIAGALRWRRGAAGGGGTVLSFDSAGRPTIPGRVVTQANQTPLPGVGTLLAFAHGVGAVPVSAELELVCLTADLGYSAGDVVNPQTSGSSTYSHSFTVARDAVNVNARTGNNSPWYIVHKSTGAISIPTNPAYWAWRFKVGVA